MTFTSASAHTAAGVVMGTARYMAPEQVRGEATDPSTEIFAFGAVLYETLSGERAFRRGTAAATMTAVLKDDPLDLSTESDSTCRLSRARTHCAQVPGKEPEHRFQSARDLSFALSASN